MIILLFNQFFFPDSAATSQLLTDVAGALVEEGHSVRAICGRGGYAAENCGELPGVSIVRTWALPFGHGTLARVLSYLSYLCGAVWFGLRGPKADVVVTLTTPPVLPLVGWLVTAVRGGRHTIWEMDVYPDIAVELGVLRGRSWLTRGLGWALNAVRRRAAGVIVLGESMRERLLRHGIPAELLHVAENWADGGEDQAKEFPAGGPQASAERSPLQVLYSGNLGLAHDVETLFGALEALKADPRFQFTFAGGGPQRPALEKFCSSVGRTPWSAADPPVGLRTSSEAELADAVGSRTNRSESELAQAVGSRTNSSEVELADAVGIRTTWPTGGSAADRGVRPTPEPSCSERGFQNVEFRGYSARHELASSLAACHVGLVTQKVETLGAVVPSKVYGLMGAGRGVLYVGPAAGTPARLISRFGCGWQVEPGDVAGLVALLRRLAEDFGEVEEKGKRGYAAFREFYDRKAGVGRICKILVGQTITLCGLSSIL